MDRAFRPHGRVRKCIKIVVRQKGRDHLQDLGVDGKINEH